jgi:hypothetical protein
MVFGYTVMLGAAYGYTQHWPQRLYFLGSFLGSFVWFNMLSTRIPRVIGLRKLLGFVPARALAREIAPLPPLSQGPTASTDLDLLPDHSTFLRLPDAVFKKFDFVFMTINFFVMCLSLCQQFDWDGRAFVYFFTILPTGLLTLTVESSASEVEVNMRKCTFLFGFLYTCYMLIAAQSGMIVDTTDLTLYFHSATWTITTSHNATASVENAQGGAWDVVNAYNVLDVGVSRGLYFIVFTGSVWVEVEVKVEIEVGVSKILCDPRLPPPTRAGRFLSSRSSAQTNVPGSPPTRGGPSSGGQVKNRMHRFGHSSSSGQIREICHLPLLLQMPCCWMSSRKRSWENSVMTLR